MSKFMDMLPFLYHNSDYIESIQNSLEDETYIYKEEFNDFINNLFIESSTWSLEFWEKFLNVKSVSKDIETRRNVIKNKLKFRNITNKEAILELCSKYGFGQVEIKEEFEEGKIYIRFISKEGEPQNLKDLIRQLDLIMPSHVSYDFYFTYILWEEIQVKKWEDVKKMTWNTIRKLNERQDKLISIPSNNTIPSEKMYPSKGVKI